jgi:hypothetical protein
MFDFGAVLILGNVWFWDKFDFWTIILGNVLFWDRFDLTFVHTINILPGPKIDGCYCLIGAC